MDLDVSKTGDEATAGEIKKMSQLHVLDSKGLGPGRQRQGQGLASYLQALESEQHYSSITKQ